MCGLNKQMHLSNFVKSIIIIIIIIIVIQHFSVTPVIIIRIFISVINQLDAQNFSFTISLFHASTYFEHMCS